MPSPQDKKQISIRVPTDVVAKFDKLAAHMDRDRTWVMLQALRRYLERHDELVAAQQAAAPEAADGAQGDPTGKFMSLTAKLANHPKAKNNP
jgi:predicted transcriptional regulator